MKTTIQILNPTNTEKVSQPFSSQFLLKRVFLTPAGTAQLGWQQGRSVTHLNQSNTLRGIQNHTEPKHTTFLQPHPAQLDNHGIFPLGKNETQFTLVNSLIAKSKATSDTYTSYKPTWKITLVKKILIRVVWDFYHHLVLAYLPCIKNGWVAYP